MPESRDLFTAWQDAFAQLWNAAEAGTGPPAEAMRPLLAPLQRQTELLQEAIGRQAAFESQLVGRLLSPFNGALDALEQTSTAMRAQAKAFDAAATSFSQASKLLAQQADFVDAAARSLRDPIDFLRTTREEFAGTVTPAAPDKRVSGRLSGRERLA
jgi:ABC-type transporter Mla subunit MlaD